MREINEQGAAIFSRVGWAGRRVFDDPVLGRQLQLMILVKEWARCFCARPASAGEDFKNYYAFANAKPEASGWSAALPDRALDRLSPHGFGDGYKCCMAKMLSPVGCPSCGSNRLRTGCVGACAQRHRRMIWCKRCFIAPFCSRECKVNSAAEHEEGCEHVAAQLREIGLGNVCYFCGVPEGTEGITLSRCARCGAAFYCSRECQTADWKAGHKADCGRPTESEGLGARASSSSQHRPGPDRAASADPRVEADGNALAAARAEMEQTARSLVQARGSPVSNLDISDPWQLVLLCECVRAANAAKELASTGTVSHALRVGSIVVVHSLVSAKQHNRSRGEVTGMPAEGSDRYAVYLEPFSGRKESDTRETINVRGRNLCDVTDLHRAAGLLGPGNAPVRESGSWLQAIVDSVDSLGIG